LASRFGEIALSMEEIEDIANRLTESEYTANIDIYVTEKQKLEEIEKNIEEDIETLNKLNWKVSVGMELKEGEIEQYKTTIESFISNAEEYIDQQHYVVKLALDAIIQDDEDFKKEITEIVDEFYSDTKGVMESLGKQLRQTTDDALADGVLDDKERKLIDNLIKEYNEVFNKVADAEFKAKLHMITVEGDLTPQSFQDLVAKVQEKIQDRLDVLKEAHFTALTNIELAYQAKLDKAKSNEERAKLQEEWSKEVEKLAEEFSKTEAVVTFEGISFAYDVLIKNYKDGFDGAAEVLGQELKDWLSEDWYEQYINSPAENVISGMVTDMQLMVEEAMQNSGLSKAARTGLDQMLDGLEPTREDYQKIFDDALKSGQQVPDGINDALTADMALRALSNNMDGIWYLMGQKLSTDKVFLEALSKAENAGKLLNDDIIKGLKSKIPDLKKEGNNLVFDLSNAIKKASENKGKYEMPKTAKNLINGITTTFNNDTTAKNAAKSWLDGIAGVVKSYKMPDITAKVSVDYSALKDLDNYYFSTNITGSYTLPGGYATGGFPNTGELFMARENGIPEMVGRIGNRTAVANNDQITEGIAIAVENAMMNVLVPVLTRLNGNNNSGDIAINIDGKEVFRAVRNQSKQYYDMTGKAPFPA